jgi:hypothetical protein
MPSPQTTGKSLEEIDLIFAKDSITQSALANEVHVHHHPLEKETPLTIERVT